MDVYKKAGERIFIARTMRGYTRVTLAEMAEISPKFLYEIEVGKKGFSALVLYNLCEALKIDCDYIMTGKKDAMYDHNLVRVLQLFKREQVERLTNILREIYMISE